MTIAYHASDNASDLHDTPKHSPATLQEERTMTTFTRSSPPNGRRGLGRMLGILFVGLCVLAIVLNLLLPRRSSAASNTIVLNPDADASVTQSSPTKASPTSSQPLAIGGSSARQSFLRFTVGGIPAGTDVQSARLRMVVINDSTSGGIISAISNTTWAEDITWNTRPAVDGPQLVQLGPVALNQVVEVDVTAAIK